MLRSPVRALAGAAIFAACSGQVGCAGSGSFVWFKELPPEPTVQANDYLITVGDILNVTVFGHADMTVRQRVRADGRIAVPLVGEVEARGKRPSALRAELEARLKDYVVQPTVTVNIDESQPVTISILGEVAHPGVFTIEPNAGLAQALALGGGLTAYASEDRIYVVRRRPAATRIRFTYRAISRNEGHAAEFPLHPSDLVVVE